MRAIFDIRLVPEFACVTVPDEIRYAFTNHTTFKEILRDLMDPGALNKIGFVGIDATPKPIYEQVLKDSQVRTSTLLKLLLNIKEIFNCILEL